MSEQQDKPPAVRKELGQVRVTQEDEVLVNSAIDRLSDWLLRENQQSRRIWRYPGFGSVLSVGRFVAWAVLYALERDQRDNHGWPERIMDQSQRLALLKRRRACLGACRVHFKDADAFRRACRQFIKDLKCRPSERMNQSKYLTLAVVGFAECVNKTPDMYNLPEPPWTLRR